MDKQLIQHNAITEARYEMSALEKNILYMLMGELQEDDPPGKEYVVSAANLEKAVGSIREKRARISNRESNPPIIPYQTR